MVLVNRFIPDFGKLTLWKWYSEVAIRISCVMACTRHRLHGRLSFFAEYRKHGAVHGSRFVRQPQELVDWQASGGRSSAVVPGTRARGPSAIHTGHSPDDVPLAWRLRRRGDSLLTDSTGTARGATPQPTTRQEEGSRSQSMQVSDVIDWLPGRVERALQIRTRARREAVASHVLRKWRHLG